MIVNPVNDPLAHLRVRTSPAWRIIRELLYVDASHLGYRLAGHRFVGVVQQRAGRQSLQSFPPGLLPDAVHDKI